jgi:hypothetical protein
MPVYRNNNTINAVPTAEQLEDAANEVFEKIRDNVRLSVTRELMDPRHTPLLRTFDDYEDTTPFSELIFDIILNTAIEFDDITLTDADLITARNYILNCEYCEVPDEYTDIWSQASTEQITRAFIWNIGHQDDEYAEFLLSVYDAIQAEGGHFIQGQGHVVYNDSDDDSDE